ncbi:hypothetical protein INS49_014377 [Diaporthe citri]|uniref:uncharacterized protein n=1 Tax=Diaporthe citri TaxID=83186 RepID=UPI001C7F62C3|nr:uncharacterized protein INS49_014377 [Diaporthe citri]KAG6358493.1 hypothetical protein INS49_014377 [Diaporthe citri]
MATDQNQDQREVLDDKVERSGMMDGPDGTEVDHDDNQKCPAMEINQKKPEPLGFLDLPAEIRNKIYQLALVDRFYARLITNLTPPALTLVNRQILAEALPIYYAGNNFYLLLWATDDGLSDQDPVLFHRFTQMMEYFGRRTTSPTDESPMRYIMNIVVQINPSTYGDPPRYSKVYSTVVDDVDPETAANQTYSSLCIRSEKQRIPFTSDSATEKGPFDPTKYRWIVKNVTFGSRDKLGGRDRFRSVKEASDLVNMSFTGSAQPIEKAIGIEYYLG